MNSITFCVSFLLCCMVKGQQNQCTVGGKSSQCTLITNCPSLLALVNKQERTPSEVDLLKAVHCGFEGTTPTVCCPIENKSIPNTRCYTPEGKPGKCRDIKSCKNIQRLLLPPVRSDNAEYVEKSRCYGRDQYSVCCGPEPELKPTEKGNCRNKLSAFPPDPSSDCCGLQASQVIDKARPVSDLVDIDEYPWLALIEYARGSLIKVLCTGSLISRKYVITAAHCLTGEVLKNNVPKNVRLGEYDTSHTGSDCVTTPGGGEDCSDGDIKIPIEKTITHPEYKPGDTKHDIALIRLAQRTPYTDFIRPICLPSFDAARKNPAPDFTVAGWGSSSNNDFGSNADIKKRFELSFVNLTECQAEYDKPLRRLALWRGHICARGKTGKRFCNGDSGSPLMYKVGIVHHVAGIVIFGPRSCGETVTPEVYTNIYVYNGWIRSNIEP